MYDSEADQGISDLRQGSPGFLLRMDVSLRRKRQQHAADQKRDDEERHRHFGEGEAADASRRGRDGANHGIHVVKALVTVKCWSVGVGRWPTVKPSRTLRKG